MPSYRWAASHRMLCVSGYHHQQTTCHGHQWLTVHKHLHLPCVSHLFTLCPRANVTNEHAHVPTPRTGTCFAQHAAPELCRVYDSVDPFGLFNPDPDGAQSNQRSSCSFVTQALSSQLSCHNEVTVLAALTATAAAAATATTAAISACCLPNAAPHTGLHAGVAPAAAPAAILPIASSFTAVAAPTCCTSATVAATAAQQVWQLAGPRHQHRTAATLPHSLTALLAAATLTPSLPPSPRSLHASQAT